MNQVSIKSLYNRQISQHTSTGRETILTPEMHLLSFVVCLCVSVCASNAAVVSKPPPIKSTGCDKKCKPDWVDLLTSTMSTANQKDPSYHKIQKAICDFAKDSTREIISTCGTPTSPKTKTGQTCCESRCVSSFVLECWKKPPTHVNLPQSVFEWTGQLMDVYFKAMST